MAIAFRAAGAVQAAASGNVTPALPTGWQNNDLAICLIASLDNVNSTMPAGWTAIDAGTNNGAGLRVTAFYRLLQTGDTNPLVTHTAGSGISAAIACWSGCSTSSPIEVIGSTSVNTSSTTATATGITTTGDNAMVVMLVGVGAKLTLSAWSNSRTEEVDGPNTNSRPEIGMADALLASHGATGNGTCTISGAGAVSNGILVALHLVQALTGTPAGGMAFGGGATVNEAVTKSPDGSAALTFGGAATANLALTKAPDGSTALTFGGGATANLALVKAPSGATALTFSGSAAANVSLVKTPAGDAGLVFSGVATVNVALTKSPDGSAALTFGGTATANLALVGSVSGEIDFGGTASSAISLAAVMGGSPGLIFGGAAAANFGLAWTGTGGLELGGAADFEADFATGAQVLGPVRRKKRRRSAPVLDAPVRVAPPLTVEEFPSFEDIAIVFNLFEE